MITKALGGRIKEIRNRELVSVKRNSHSALGWIEHTLLLLKLDDETSPYATLKTSLMDWECPSANYSPAFESLIGLNMTEG